MMKKTILLVVCAVFATTLFAQKNPLDGFTKSPSGVNYKFHIKNDAGTPVKADDVIVGKFWIMFGDSIMTDGSKMESQPFLSASSDQRVFKGDLIDGVLLMKKGETCTFAFERDSIAKLFPQIPDYFKSGMYAYWKIQIDDIKTAEQMKAENEKMQKEQEGMAAQRKVMADSLIKLEPQKIQEAIKTYGIENKLKDGIYFKPLFYSNNTEKIENGDKVKVHYIGKFTDGKLFDTSVEEEAKKAGKHQQGRAYEPLEFSIGAKMMIPGFEAGVKMMSKGDKALLLIPSKLAYGEGGRGEIDPATPLMFEIEVVSIEKGAPAPKTNAQPIKVTPTKSTKPAQKATKSTKK